MKSYRGHFCTPLKCLWGGGGGVIRLCPLQFPSLSVFPCDPASLYYDLWNDMTAKEKKTLCVCSPV